jgi:hypothetical protein
MLYQIHNVYTHSSLHNDYCNQDVRFTNLHKIPIQNFLYYERVEEKSY